MKGILVREFGGPEVMRVEELPDPRPGPGEVAVRIRAIGVNPVDAYIRSGTYARKPSLPYVPGSDAAGEIDEIGGDVKEFSRGDRVYFFGTREGRSAGAYAQRAVCAVAQVYRLPARASFAQGAALGVPYATAYRALFHRARAEPSETVLVHGATGGVGIAAVQLARARGLRVIASGGSDRGLQTVKEQGADVVVDHRTPDYTAEIMAATGQRGVDVIVEMAAHVNLGRDLALLATHGRVVVVGSRGPIQINPRDAMGRDASIHGMTLFNVTPPELASIHAAIGAALADGTVHPIIGRELALSEASGAHELVMQRGALGKIVLVP
jgi:NADPH2:quinone reductase